MAMVARATNADPGPNAAPPSAKGAPVPGGHLARLARLGGMASRVAGAMTAEAERPSGDHRHRRVSVERVVAGPGLVEIHEILAAIEGRPAPRLDAVALWTAALAGRDSLAVAALDRFCLSLGSVAGDLALAHGAGGVVIAGGLGLRLAEHLPRSGFAQRFAAKGRFESMMAALPVKLVTRPEPGLFGAAAAFAAEHG